MGVSVSILVAESVVSGLAPVAEAMLSVGAASGNAVEELSRIAKRITVTRAANKRVEIAAEIRRKDDDCTSPFPSRGEYGNAGHQARDQAKIKATLKDRLLCCY
jgi:hypothetical protein